MPFVVLHYFAVKMAMVGRKVVYLSLEEAYEDICNRLYSSVYKVSYTSLHSGSAYMELEQKFNSLEDLDADRKRLLTENLCVIGLKDKTPMNTLQIFKELENKYEETGFIPDIVELDQMQFLTPQSTTKGEQAWTMESRVSRECDQLSHRQIGGQHFGLLVNHQARGKLKKTFSSEDISGFKGIMQPTDLVMGIGREGPMSVDFEVFSLKSRHSNNFSVPLVGNLEFMEFLEPPSGTSGEKSSITEVAARNVTKSLMQTSVDEMHMGNISKLLTKVPNGNTTESVQPTV